MDGVLRKETREKERWKGAPTGDGSLGTIRDLPVREAWKTYQVQETAGTKGRRLQNSCIQGNKNGNIWAKA